MQRYIQDVLVNNGYGPETIIKEIMEMAWLHKNKKDSGNTLNLTKIIYQQGMNNANF